MRSAQPSFFREWVRSPAPAHFTGKIDFGELLESLASGVFVLLATFVELTEPYNTS